MLQGVMMVHVQFSPELKYKDGTVTPSKPSTGWNNKQYAYKTLDKTIEAGDVVIVDSPSSGLTAVYVHSVSKVLDAEVDFKYKWVVAKVDLRQYANLLAVDKQFESVLDHVNYNKKRTAMLNEVIDGLTSDELKAFGEVLTASGVKHNLTPETPEVQEASEERFPQEPVPVSEETASIRQRSQEEFEILAEEKPTSWPPKDDDIPF